MNAPEPTEQDRENARRRQAIADKQNAEYDGACLLALGALGPGWTPWMKISLIPSDYHQGGSREPVAVAYKVYRRDQRLTENAVYLRKLPDGTVQHATSYEPLFGELLTEPHPTRGFEHDGSWVPFPKYSLTWAALERYEPKSPEALAALRVSRERNKLIREQAAYERDFPLFAEIERQEREEGRGR